MIRLIGITREGAPAEAVTGLPKVALEACASTASLYQKAGFSPPWIGYLALCDSEVVGTCAFTAAPAAGRVEIAYFTFPAFERRGVATAMAAELIAVARSAQTNIEIFAQTLPERNASNAILCKLGFELRAKSIIQRKVQFGSGASLPAPYLIDADNSEILASRWAGRFVSARIVTSTLPLHFMLALASRR